MSQQLKQTETLDLKTWLNNENLDALYSKFENTSLTLHDLTSNNESALGELFDYIGCNPIEKIKLITALKSIPTAAVNKTKEVIFLSEKEHEIMQQLNKKQAMISDNIKQIKNAINHLKKGDVKYNENIHSKCDELISSVENYRKLLLENIQNIKNERKNILETQVDYLQKLNKNVMKSVNECKEIAFGQSNDKYNEMKQVLDKYETQKKIDINVNIKLHTLFESKLEYNLFAKFNEQCAFICLAQQRREWSKSHPVGFFARPCKNPDGSTNLLSWKCGIPGKKKSHWEGGLYRLNIFFTDNYPNERPKCMFNPVIFHPNVYPSGTVDILQIWGHDQWEPTITIKQLLLGIQELLAKPNNADPAQKEPYELYRKDQDAFWNRVRLEAKKYAM